MGELILAPETKKKRRERGRRIKKQKQIIEKKTKIMMLIKQREILAKNYACPSTIMEISNRITELRRDLWSLGVCL